MYVIYMYYAISQMYYRKNNPCTAEILITFEAWAKLTQKWLVCAPLRIHLEPINE